MKKVVVRLPKIYSANGDLSKKWFVYYYVINPLTDKLQRFQTKSNVNSFDTQKERMSACIALQAEIKTKLLAGWTPYDQEDVIYEDELRYAGQVGIAGKKAKSKKTARYYLSDYLQKIKPTLTTKSYESYVSKLRLFCTYLEVNELDYDVSVINNKMILKFFDHLINEKMLASGTIDKYRRHIQSFFDYIKKERKLIENPVYDIPRTAINVDKAPRPIPQNYLNALNQLLVHDAQLWLVTRLEYYCAIRPGEIRHLKLKDIDMIGEVIRVSSMWSKNGKSETIAMPRQMIDELNATYDLSLYDGEFYLIGRNGEPGPEMVGKNTLRVRFNMIRDRLNLPKEFKLYSYKHTAAVKLASTNMPVKQIQQHFRHSRLDTTDRYMQRMAAYATESMKNDFPDL